MSTLFITGFGVLKLFTPGTSGVVTSGVATIAGLLLIFHGFTLFLGLTVAASSNGTG